MSEKARDPVGEGEHQKNWLEWLVFGGSCLLVGCAVGYLAVEAVKEGEGPAELEVNVGRAMRTATGIRIPVTVLNHGGRVAANVQVTLKPESEELPEGNIVIDFVPKNSERKAWIVIPDSPPGDGVWLPKVIGYDEP